ncbi:Poly [ADP-ribose] polymerase 2, partial [Modicella reniformis]
KFDLLLPDDVHSDDEEEEDKSKRKNKGKDYSKLLPKVQELVALIFNTGMMNGQMKELDYDADKMPLDKLAKSTILHGYAVLKRISEVIDGKPNMTLLSELSKQVYTVIPHNFGGNVPPVIKGAPTLEKKMEMLEALGEIEVAQKLMKENQKHEASVKLNKLEP